MRFVSYSMNFELFLNILEEGDFWDDVTLKLHSL